jgi:hypothetical protein
MERVAGEVDSGKLVIGDVDLGVVVLVEAGVELEPGGGVGRADQVDDGRIDRTSVVARASSWR